MVLLYRSAGKHKEIFSGIHHSILGICRNSETLFENNVAIYVFLGIIKLSAF